VWIYNDYIEVANLIINIENVYKSLNKNLLSYSKGLHMDKKISTGIPEVDELLDGGLEPSAITEFYGYNWRLVKMLMHRIIGEISLRRYIDIIYNQLFDGLDPYLLLRIVKKLGGNWDIAESNIRLIRCFKPEDLIEALSHYRGDLLVIVDPYLHIDDPIKKWVEASSISAAIYKLLLNEVTIIVFNKTFHIGYRPSGGNFHHHIIHYLVRVEAGGEGYILLKLEKSPLKRGGYKLLSTDSFIGIESSKQQVLYSWMEVYRDG
jgi:hypothetical protein